jgi:uncharacterized protein with PIN domain
MKAPSFIADQNVGKLARLLRMIGYDASVFNGDDDQMVKVALLQRRIVLTRDTEIIKRRIVSSGDLRVILIEDEDPDQQVVQVIREADLAVSFKPFSRCLDCNSTLESRLKRELKEKVPAYVYKTQSYFKECPECHNIYWPGSHWEAMVHRIKQFRNG